MSPTPASLSLTAARRVDAACDRFEAAWQAGGAPPRIEDFVEGDGPEADALLRELVLLDAHYRRRAGEAPSTLEYEARFPGLDPAWLRGVLAPDDSARTAGPAPAAAPAPGPVAGYEVLGELGRGGMGVVYRARQVSLGRTVALKVIRGADHAGPAERDRFRREAEAVARMQHPNIVTVFEVGDHAGQPFFALELVEGGTLAGRLAASPLPPADAARLTAVLARAIHHAHERGVIHRDLKPGNVLLMPDGTPKVADFGLAKRLDGDGPATVSGALVGTPSYMAPEQAASDAAAVGPATDVYALGAILYEALTGRPPFKGADLLDTLQQVRFSEPVAVRALQPRCPRDLETVCLKCLQKAPGGRYASARALAEDLERFAAGRPVQARPTPWWERGWKWAGRNRLAAGLSAAVAASVLVGLALVGWQWREAVAANVGKDEALGEKDRALGEKDEALGQVRDREGRLLRQAAELARQTKLAGERAEEAGRARAEAELRLEGADRSDYRARLGLAQRELENNQLDAARAALDGGRWDLCGFEHRYLFGVGQRRQRAAWHAGGLVNGLGVSPDGTLVATATEAWDGRSWRAGEVRVWRAATGEGVWLLRGHTAPVRGVAFSPDGAWLASAGNDLTVRIWDLESGKLARALRPPSAGNAVAYSRDGARLAVGLSDGSVKVYRTATWAEERSLQVVPRPAKGLVYGADGRGLASSMLAFSPDGNHLATAVLRSTADGLKEQAESAAVWDLGSGDKALSLKGVGAKAVAYTPDGKHLAVVGSSAQLFETRQGRQVSILLPNLAGAYEAVAVSGDGRWVALGGADHAVTVLDLPTRQRVLTLPGHSGRLTALAFTTDGRLVSGGDDTVRVWRTEADVAAVKLEPALFSRVLAMHPDGRRAARPLTGGVGLTDVTTGQTLRQFKGSVGQPQALAFSRDGARLAAGGSAGQGQPGQGAVRVWRVEDGQELLALTAHAGVVRCVAFSRDGTRLVTASGGRRGGKDVADVKVWDAATGQLLASCQGVAGAVRRLAISPDGKLLATVADYSFARLWDAATGQPLRYLSRPATKWCGCVAFSPDSTRVVTGHDDGRMFVWSAATGRELLAPSGHSDMVTDVTYSPDGGRLASASGVGDRSVRLWDAASGELLLSLAGHTRAVAAVTFSPDGQRLFSRGLSSELRAWDATARPAIRPLPGSRYQVFAMRLRPDGRAMATAGKDGAVKLWDLTKGRVVQTLTGHRHRVLTLAYSPDSSRLVTAGGAGKEPELRVWDAAGKELFALAGHPMYVSAAAFSPDGRRLVTSGLDGMTKVWDARSGRELRSFPWGHRGAASLAFSPDGALLAGGGRDGRLRLWAADGRPVRATATVGPSTAITDVAFSPDGARVAGACSDRVVRVWEVATGKEVLALRGHLAAARGVAYRAAGKQIVTAGEDATLRVWDAATGAPLFALSQEAAARGLSPHYAEGAVGGDWRVYRMAKEKDRYVDGVTGRVFSAPGPIIQTQFAALGVSADGRTLAASTLPNGAALYDLDALAP